MNQEVLVSNSVQPQTKLVDWIIYLASLASDVRAIDPILDKLRGIMAMHAADTTYSQEDMGTL